MIDSPLKFLGLMRKAGKLEIGEVAAEAALKKGNVRLLLLAENAGINTKKKAERMSCNSDVMLVTIPCEKEELSHSIGTNNTAIVAVTDIGFADAFLKELAKEFPQFQEQADKMKNLKGKCGKVNARRKK